MLKSLTSAEGPLKALTQSIPHLYEIVSAVLLVLQLEGEEVEVDVLAVGRLDDPVAVLLVVVVDVAELGVREDVAGRLGGSQVAAADRQVLRHEPLPLDGGVRLEHHQHGVVGGNEGVGVLGAAEPAQDLDIRD